jgi:hypothetical protein
MIHMGEDVLCCSKAYNTAKMDFAQKYVKYGEDTPPVLRSRNGAYASLLNSIYRCCVILVSGYLYPEELRRRRCFVVREAHCNAEAR